MSNRILWVIHEPFASEIMTAPLDSISDRAYLAGIDWIDRPNSTERLTLVNLLAARRLQSELDIEFRYDVTWQDELGLLYSQYDVIVINAIARNPSRNFCHEFLTWKRAQPNFKAKVIFGTEVTWMSVLKNGQITEKDLHDIYFENLLLRHTSKTDTSIYKDLDFMGSRIQEFEIGIDEDVLPRPKPIEDRKAITFVNAPPGRALKNNEGIEEVKRLLKEDPRFFNLEILELTPPYSLLDYWDVMARATFMVFTSLGETFSYALNDAKALGVITFFPQSMYTTSIASRYCVDNYPHIGIRYENPDEVISQIGAYLEDPERMVFASVNSRRNLLRTFSKYAVENNWRRLLKGHSLNENSLFIYSGDFSEWKHVVEQCSIDSASYAMPYLNEGVGGDIEGLFYVDESTGITCVKYFTTSCDDGTFVRHFSRNAARQPVFRDGQKLKKVSSSDTLGFMHLVCRTYKVGKLVIDSALRGSEFAKECGKLEKYAGLHEGLVPMSIEYV